MIPYMKLACTLFVISQYWYINTVHADCCHSDEYDQCADCTEGTPYCGYGECNWFGCNCDGGCRTEPSGSDHGLRKRNVFSDEPDVNIQVADLMETLDLNGDGQLSVEEGLRHVLNLMLPEDFPYTKDMIKYQVRAMDKNEDGFLSKSEIDGH